MSKNKWVSLPMPFSWLNRQARLLWLYFLCVIFCITAPLTVLYTIGYRYDIAQGVIRESGVLSIDVQPKNVSIYINNRLVGKKSPLRLTNLSPGRYTVSIQAPHYHTWSTEVLVEPKQTTYIKSVHLFRDLLPEILSPASSSPIFISPSSDGSMALFVEYDGNKTDIHLWDSAKQQKELIYKSNTTPTAIRTGWAPFSAFWYIAEQKTTSTILTLFSGNTTTYTYTIPLISPQLHWVRTNDNEDALATPLTSSSIALFTTETNIIIGTLTYQNAPWLIDSESTLWQWSSSTQSIFHANSTNTRFSFSTEPLQIFASDRLRIAGTFSSSSLSIFTHQKTPFQHTLTAENSRMVWNTFTNEWLVFSPQELITIYPDGTDALLLRSGSHYTNIHPLDEFGVLLLEERERLTAFNPGYYTSQTLFSSGNISAAFAYPRERLIFFFGTVGNKRGMFSLPY